MTEKSAASSGKTKRLTGWSRSFLTPALLRRRTLALAVVVSVLAVLYWGLIASDRYVSEAHVVIQRTDLADGRSVDFSNVLDSFGGNAADQYLLRDHLLSVDMLQKLDDELDLRAHYSDPQYDVLSRMWSEDVPLEWFHRYYLSRVSAEVDGASDILWIKAQAYTPEKAHAIGSMLVSEGERFLNAMAHRLAEEQVAFLEQQVVGLKERLMDSRMAVLEFQNRNAMVSPQGTTENLSAIINQLEAKLADLQTTLSAKQSFLMPGSSDLVDIKMQIAATEKQIAREKGRLASTSGDETLNVALEEYQRLQMEADFAMDIYQTALTALEKGRIDAVRTIKKISVLQRPTEPQYPLEPRRLYNSIVFILVAMLVAGIIHMLAAIIRDHKE